MIKLVSAWILVLCSSLIYPFGVQACDKCQCLTNSKHKLLCNEININSIKVLEANTSVKNLEKQLILNNNKQSILDQKVNGSEKLIEASTQSIDSMLSFVGITSSIVLAVVSILLASGLYYVIRENKSLDAKFKQKIDEAADVFIKLEKKIDTELKNKAKLEENAFLLRLELASDKDPKEIYSYVKELVMSKEERYYPLLKKVRDLSIDDQINELADTIIK